MYKWKNKYIYVIGNFVSIPSFLQAHDLKGTINSSDRTQKNVRDKYRNHVKLLHFLNRQMWTVSNISRFGMYTEIFANYLHEPGNLIVHFDSN